MLKDFCHNLQHNFGQNHDNSMCPPAAEADCEWHKETLCPLPAA